MQHLVPGVAGADVQIEMAIQSVAEFTEISSSIVIDILMRFF